MSNQTPEPITIQPLPKFTGLEAFAVDPALPWNESAETGQHQIHTSLVLDDPDYRDAIRVRVDGIEGATFYLDRINARGLIGLLTRDLEKLNLCISIDPQGVR